MHRHISQSLSRDVAQPGSASHWGCGGRRFESYRPDQVFLTQIMILQKRSHSSDEKRSKELWQQVWTGGLRTPDYLLF